MYLIVEHQDMLHNLQNLAYYIQLKDNREVAEESASVQLTNKPVILIPKGKEIKLKQEEVNEEQWKKENNKRKEHKNDCLPT